ncbi:exonuclease domain-containing protein [Brevibacillus sp. SYSU BS000544]|uniref:exonuclease domain-containing protein n=1 Tax=Brevibacillus sp. SYSU BS000544 TaxID=3416443 RepID=UPI003CE579AC
MNYVIMDIEWIVPTSYDDFPEIIEIAAIKVKEVDGLLLEGERFHQYIKPSFRKLNHKTIDMIGLKTFNFRFETKFPKIMTNFFKWLGKEKYVIMTWGQQDQLVLEQNCKMYSIKVNWLLPYKDLQFEFMSAIKAKRKVGLQQALQISGINFTGKKHSAINHAQYTCKMFMKYF